MQRRTPMTVLLLVALLASGCPSPTEPFNAPDGGDGDGDADVDPRVFIEAEAIVLDTLDPFAPRSDIAPFGELLEGRDVVMLGESDHGMAELKTARLRIVAALYHDRGIDLLGDEIGRAEAMVVQRYLDSGDETDLSELDVLSYASYSQVEELLDFYRGLRRLIEERPSGLEPLRYRGVDLDHGMVNARDEVLAFLAEADDATLTSTLTPLVTCLDVSEACDTDQSTALTGLEAASVDLAAATSQERYDEAHDVLRGLGETIHFYLILAAGAPEAPQYREDVMMRRADEYLDSAPEGMMVAAHNLHIAAAYSDIYGIRSLGEHLTTTQGRDAVYGLAMTAYQGQHLVRDDSWNFFAEDIDAPPSGSMEELLHRAELPRLLLDFGEATPEAAPWIFQSIRCVAPGYPSLRAVPGDQWDGVLYVDTVTATTPL